MNTPPCIRLAVVWHMHQPWYLDPATARPLLPWVRLHATAAYSEMAALLAQTPSMRATVGFSTALLDQLALYSEATGDFYEELTLTPADQLSPEQRTFVVQHFFSVHWGRVMARYPRYAELLERRGRRAPAGGFEPVAAGCSVAELRDLQLLFNLAHFSPATVAANPMLRALLDKGRDYSEADKQALIALHHELISELIPRWRTLVQAGAQVELCCVPGYHPMLPLLIDSHHTRRANPEVRLPQRFAFPEDAERHVRLGCERTQSVFGVTARGAWLPEGAISPEVVQLCVKAGLQYVIADGDLLFHSLDDRGSTPGRSRSLQPFRVQDCAVFFRDKLLSDLIAKDYAAWDPHSAAADFIARVRAAGAAAKVDGDGPPLVVVALAGENPWETYPEGGHAFLSALYDKLGRADDIDCTTLSEHLAAHPPVVGLDYLHSGSRIESNFDIWIGDPEKNRAWNHLTTARSRLDRAQRGQELDDATFERAMAHVLRAEGSDWFWWLGEPFSSNEDQLYESLFRAHILAVYRELGDSPPADLSRPIARAGIVEPMRPPSAPIHPRIDGTRTSYYEWRGAGFFRPPAAGSAFEKHTFFSGLYWGFDPARLYLRIDPLHDHREPSDPGLAALDLWFELTAPGRWLKVKINLASAPPSLQFLVRDSEATPWQDRGPVGEVACLEVLELAIPLFRLDLPSGTRLGLTVHVAKDGELLSLIPRQGVIEIEIPTEDFDPTTQV